MKLFFKDCLFFYSLLLFTISLTSNLLAELPTKDPKSTKALYNSLDPLSLSQYLAFYELYPQTIEGKKAIQHIWKLLLRDHNPYPTKLILPKESVQAIVSLVTRQSFDPPVLLNEEQLDLIEKIATSLGNRRLKGSLVWSKEEILSLLPEEIDLGRGLLINQFDSSAEDIKAKVRQYEAHLDLMAIQILLRLPAKASHQDKIRAINYFIFQEMQFRFPPHSLYAHDIDLYTFLPSVLDNRQGVCLGVSILYLSLAQRLNLPLEIITPPGHIYVRYRDEKELINIETTARGIHLSSDAYLGINTRQLSPRTIKEVIGMAFINEAAVFWGRGDYQTTVALYEKALPYLPEDPLVDMLLGLNYLFVGKIEEGRKLLKKIRHVTFDSSISPESIPDDYLAHRVDEKGIKVVFSSVDETRDSIVKKQKELEKTLKEYPKFRAGLLQLATTWMQLGRGSEALEILERYHKIDPTHPIVEYYLAVLTLERYDLKRAWSFLKKTEEILKKHNHKTPALFSLKRELRRFYPDPG